jgi:hypothetical protein
MKLASELRNQIYGYLVDNAGERPVSRILRKSASTETPDSIASFDKTAEKLKAGIRNTVQGGVIPNPTKRAKEAHSLYQDLSLTCGQNRAEFTPLLQVVEPDIVNLVDIYDYLDTFHSPANAGLPDVRIGSCMVDTRFEAPNGVDLLPLLHILSQPPDLRISFLPEKLPGSKKLATAYFPGINQLFSAYANWEDLEPLLDLQEIRLCANHVLTRGTPTCSIRLVIAPTNANLVRRFAVGLATKTKRATTVVTLMLSWATELIYRPGLVHVDLGNAHFRIHCDFGVDGVTWAVKTGVRQRVGVTVKLFKGSVENTVLMKPKPLELEARPSGVEVDRKMWRMVDCATGHWAVRGP